MLAALLTNLGQVKNGGATFWPEHLQSKRRRDELKRRRKQRQKAREAEKERYQRTVLELQQRLETAYEKVKEVPALKEQVEKIVEPYVRQRESGPYIDYSLILSQFVVMRQLLMLYEMVLDDEEALMLLL